METTEPPRVPAAKSGIRLRLRAALRKRPRLINPQHHQSDEKEEQRDNEVFCRLGLMATKDEEAESEDKAGV